MNSGLLLDVVVGKSAVIFQLLSGKDETLLVWWNTFLVLDLGLDVFNSVAGFDFKSDSLASQSLDKDLKDMSNWSRIFINLEPQKGIKH